MGRVASRDADTEPISSRGAEAIKPNTRPVLVFSSLKVEDRNSNSKWTAKMAAVAATTAATGVG